MTLKWIITVVSFSAAQLCVQADVTFEVKMSRFVSHGKDWDGDSCDIFGGDCDPKFTFCLDVGNGNDHVSSCAYGSYKTSHYQTANNVYFGANMKGVSNPIKKTLNSWPGSIRFKTEAKDDDYDSDDLIDRIYYKYSKDPAASSSGSSWTNKLVYGTRSRAPKTELHFSVRAYCNEFSFGSKCDVYCKARNDESGHYTCNSQGEKICRPGWETVSADCTIKIDNCEDHDCQNEAACVDGYNSYTCDCLPGYSGTTCGVNINECASGPCLNGGVCTDELNGFRCECPRVYTGTRCQHHLCDTSQYCHHGGTCYDDGQGFVACLCPVRFTGVHCDVDTCDVLQCQNGGSCHDGICECPPDYIGALCDVYLCEHISCQNGGTCAAGMCICPTGWTGQYCHININDCKENDCQHDATCEDQINGYTCSCLPGFSGTYCEVIECYCINGGTCREGVCLCPFNYTGDTCEDHICDITSCDNGGSCEVVNTSAQCNCLEGFTGQWCEVDLCQDVNCLNNGVCSAGHCICEPNYTGLSCESHICDVYGCQNEATCSADNGQAMCMCTKEFTGVKCDVNKCQNLTCHNHGVCVAGQCICHLEYTGLSCESHVCEVYGCQNKAACSADNGQAMCMCTEEFTGVKCDVNKCQDVICQNGGHCKLGECHCEEDFTGSLCDVDLCKLITCDNGGSCKAGTCLCLLGFTGQFCHVDIDDCASSPCQNEAECEDHVNAYYCRCLDGYNGTHCETLIDGPSISNVGNQRGQRTEGGALSKTALGVIIAVVCLLFFIVVVAALLFRKYRRHKSAESSSSTASLERTEFDNPVYDDITDSRTPGGSGGAMAAHPLPVSKGKKVEEENGTEDFPPPPYTPDTTVLQFDGPSPALRVGPLSPPSYTESEAVHSHMEAGASNSQQPIAFVNQMYATENECKDKKDGEGVIGLKGKERDHDSVIIEHDNSTAENEYNLVLAAGGNSDYDYVQGTVENERIEKEDGGVYMDMSPGTENGISNENVNDNLTGCSSTGYSYVTGAGNIEPNTESIINGKENQDNETAESQENEYDSVGKLRRLFEK